jgi:hypothetical protein
VQEARATILLVDTADHQACSFQTFQQVAGAGAVDPRERCEATLIYAGEIVDTGKSGIFDVLYVLISIDCGQIRSANLLEAARQREWHAMGNERLAGEHELRPWKFPTNQHCIPLSDLQYIDNQ